MSELMHNWILGLTAAAMLTACAGILCDKGGTAKVLHFAGGLLLLSALLGPLQGLDWQEYALALSEARELSEKLSGELEEKNRDLERLYIEKECAAYILDEARKLGLEGSVEVRAKWMDSAFLPWEARLSFAESQARKTLSGRIEAELGIPEGRQYWQ